MKLTDFDYHLPEELIAQTPAEPRDSAKLLHVKRNSWEYHDKIFSDIGHILWKNDVLVVNETRVIKARLKGKIITNTLPFNWREVPEGGWDDLKACEIFLHAQISDTTWDCLVYPGKKLKPWTQVIFLFQPRGWNNDENSKSPGLTWSIISNSESWRIVEFNLSWEDFFNAISQIWETPLPPYIKDSNTPDERYQTVYNDQNKSGSVAAPTAGLHFTPELLKKLENKWVMVEKVCLHVWLGTFMNVEVENIQDHHMHSERAYISENTSKKLNAYKQEWKRIIAVGTTSVRTLESFSGHNWLIWHGDINTDIFIFPGYQWRCVDAIITNFHLPKSTLLMLVSSFIWDENRKKVYQHAVASKYRFFSFWDAMFLE